MHPDALLAGRYRLRARIGRGAMGEVWRATDERLRRDVAIKVVDLGSAGPSGSDRFEREVLAAARLHHPNVVTTFDAGTEGDVAYLVMELLGGESLAQRLQAGPLPVAEARRIAAEVADALAATHGIGIVHRDIKPGNVQLPGDGRVKVLDFGIAELADSFSTAVAAEPVTQVIGTAAYLAPERASGHRGGPAADCYSLGCLLFALLTGRPPYGPGGPAELAAQHLNAPIPSVRALRPDVPADLDALVAALLAKNPAARPSAAQAADALWRPASAPASWVAAGTAVLPPDAPRTAVLPAPGGTAVLPPAPGTPPATAVLPPSGNRPPVAPVRPADATLPASMVLPRRENLADGGSTRLAAGSPSPWLRRGAGWLARIIAVLLLVGAVLLVVPRLLGLLPSGLPGLPGSATTSKAPSTTTTSKAPRTTSSRPATPQITLPKVPVPTISLPPVPLPPIDLPDVGDAGQTAKDAARDAALRSVETALATWQPNTERSQRAKASLQESWAGVQEKVRNGEDGKKALKDFSDEVKQQRRDGNISVATETSLITAVAAVRGLV